MQYSTLGGTGAKVSILGFGGAALGLTNYLERFSPDDPDDRRGLFEAIEAALDVGINHFDTAAAYGNGASERVLGEADSVYRFIRSGSFDTVQLCYNFIFQHPYETSRPFGTLYEAEDAGLGIVTMRGPTSGTFQRWIQRVNPANTFDYTPALIQFVLSNPLVDVALVGMRTPAIVRANAAIVDDVDGRIDIAAVQERYV